MTMDEKTDTYPIGYGCVKTPSGDSAWECSLTDENIAFFSGKPIERPAQSEAVVGFMDWVRGRIAESFKRKQPLK